MAVTNTPFSNPLGANIVRDADSDGTAENDVRGGAATLYMVDVDNTANGAATYTKIYNNVAPTIGTTVPDVVIMTPASVRRVVAFPGGLAFSTAISMASTTAGGTAGTTGPTSDVIVLLVTS